jgi:hypothetical protein
MSIAVGTHLTSTYQEPVSHTRYERADLASPPAKLINKDVHRWLKNPDSE